MILVDASVLKPCSNVTRSLGLGRSLPERKTLGPMNIQGPGLRSGKET